ncbi:hypothetical protein COCNU_04G008640 [Cocos nucifera]|uniref:Uncharacterized protein n=1 Tax=Cocos nucifera TaxID=13894 RepID=A0A8K0I5W2_COCNU|nr:hypothetical protein COCNU_04G008640 [Cocos nucifera]
MKVPSQKELITEEALYEARLGPAPSVGMHPPLKIFMDEVHQFATQKRVVSGASSLHAPKKGSEASYWIGFGDGWDVIRQLFPDLDLSSIIVQCAGEEEERGNDGSPGSPMDDGAPTTASTPIESAPPMAPAALTKGALVPSAPMDIVLQLAAKVSLESQEVASTKAVLPTDTALTIEVDVASDQPSEQPIDK